MTLTYEISDIASYINWVYFYHAWGMSGKPETEIQKLRQEAETALMECEGRYQAFARFRLFYEVAVLVAVYGRASSGCSCGGVF